MRLAAELVYAKICETFDPTDSFLEEDCPELGSPLIFEDGQAVCDSHLYLSDVSSRELCQQGQFCVYLNGAKPSSDGGSYVCLEEGLATAFNGVQQIFDELRVQDCRSDTALHKVCQKILFDRTADYMEMSRELTKLGWDEKDSYFCSVICAGPGRRKNQDTRLLSDFIKGEYPNSCTVIYKTNIITFYNMTKEGRSLYEVTKAIKIFARDCFLKVGFGRVMKGHTNLHRQYLQACIALRMGSRLKPHRWVCDFDTFAFPYMLEQITQQLPCHMICHRKLLELKAYDAEQNSEYIKTLRTYLDENLNVVQTAKKLYIHRSTVFYRLDRIKEILESNLDDPDELLYLSVSLRILS